MKKMNDYSRYIFYRFYRSMELMNVESWDVWRASSLTMAVEFFALFCVFIPITYLIGYDFISLPFIFACVLFLAIRSYLILDRDKKWKKVLEKFDQLPAARQKSYKRNFWLLILGIIVLLIVEFYLMWLFRTW